MRVLSVIHGPDAHAGIFAEAVRDAGHELHQASYALEQPPSRPVAAYDAAMVFGGSMNTHEEDAHPWLRPEREAIRELLDAEVPLLGVCLGSQLIAQVAGAGVHRSSTPEIGWYEVELAPEAADDPIFAALPERFTAFQWHSYRSALPADGVELARNDVSLQAYRIGSSVWGIQFHAEVTRQIVETWISHSRTDPDAAAGGFDPERARAELAERIDGWNRFGRALVGGFIAQAEVLTGAPAARARG